ncbi:pentapeptide repeat-containing protein [Actinokineospora globicatena]|uniref:pentapeptide repeat-containing protein n=1 Tax=Actinokineospora globicatena TaxID=103729 RepID=UPI0020A5E563|nr:pentapeptide repeat-containing protein [Actinokineospora globicatena]
MRRPATEQDSWDAAVDSFKVGRRSLLVGAVALPLGALGSYLGVAATKDYWPFGTSAKSVTELARALNGAASSGERIAILQEMSAKGVIGHPDRGAVVGVLAEFLRTQNGISQTRRATAADTRNKAPEEISVAFSILGKSGTNYLEADLRGANLSGIDVRGLDFSGGITMYGAKMTGSVLADCNFGGGNWGAIDLSGSWFAGGHLNGLNLTDSVLNGAVFPGSRLLGCQFAGAEISDVDFSSSDLDECDFSGQRLDSSGRRNAHWLPGKSPSWPTGYKPNFP